MVELYEKWWDNYTKVFSIRYLKKVWKKNGIRPHLSITNNGGKRKNGDECFDFKITIGYLVINYTNFDLQRREY